MWLKFLSKPDQTWCIVYHHKYKTDKAMDIFNFRLYIIFLTAWIVRPKLLLMNQIYLKYTCMSNVIPKNNPPNPYMASYGTLARALLDLRRSTWSSAATEPAALRFEGVAKSLLLEPGISGRLISAGGSVNDYQWREWQCLEEYWAKISSLHRMENVKYWQCMDAGESQESLYRPMLSIISSWWLAPQLLEVTNKFSPPVMGIMQWKQ